MILYADTSAHIKQYVKEPGSDVVAQWIGEAMSVGCAVIGHAEMVATIAKLVRMKLLTRSFALVKIEEIRSDWRDVVHLQMSDSLVTHAGDLSWQHGLRGYDAVHPACRHCLRLHPTAPNSHPTPTPHSCPFQLADL